MFQLAIDLTAKQYHPSAAAFISFTVQKRENKSNFFNNHPIPIAFYCFIFRGENFFQFIFKLLLYLLSRSKHNRPNHLIRWDKVIKWFYNTHFG